MKVPSRKGESGTPTPRAGAPEAGKPAERCAWHQCLLDEACEAAGHASAALLADVVKCFEGVRHDILLAEARAAGFPLAVLRMALCSYRSARRVVWDGACSEPVVASRAILAGCVHATGLLHAFFAGAPWTASRRAGPGCQAAAAICRAPLVMTR